MEIDEIDRRILQSVRDLPRGTTSDRAASAGVSRVTFRSRLDRLWDTGVIIGHEPQLDLAALGFKVQAWVEFKVVQGHLDEVRDALQLNPSVIEAFSTTGAADVRCRIAGKSTSHLQSILIELGQSPYIARTESAVILDSLVSHRKVQALDLLN